MAAEAEPAASRLVRWAIEAGFDEAGVAALTPSEQGHYLRRWLERGEHAGMEWIARRTEVRENPAHLLPGAKSVLCVTLQYWPLEGQREPSGDLWPRVARYARGRDYHDVMGKKLKKLAARIREEWPECGTRPYVDTGPILERELAARAGLGAQGKNTMLLSRERGSWFLLGEILLTAELVTQPSEEAKRAEGPPALDLCGNCTRCLEACPTDALVEPYRLDSRRCISYWTIEHRGDLPPAAREMVGEWVFGCDVCQEACPWNDRPRSGTPRPVDHPRLRLPARREALDLEGLLALDREGYLERFQVSPLKRAKLEGLKRNAIVAMGNRRDGKYVAALTETLRTSEPLLRRHAAWSLGRIGTSEAAGSLRSAYEREAEASVKTEIAEALETIRNARKTVDTPGPPAYTARPEFSRT